MSEAIAIDLGESPEGYRVDETSIKVLNLGDGLSKSMKVEPVMVHAGEKVFFLIEAVKTKDQFEYAFTEDDNVESVELIQSFKAKTAMIFDDDVARQAIARMTKKIADAAALEKSGQGSMLRTCIACGWKEGGTEELCVNGNPLHDFVNPLEGELAGDPEGDNEG